MTDPLALDPVLPPRERSALSFNDDALDHDERYRRFEEQKVLSWRESNDLVSRIGGWQAYARESAGGEAMPDGHEMHKPAPSDAAASAPMPALAASKPAPSPHDGHKPPKTP